MNFVVTVLFSAHTASLGDPGSLPCGGFQAHRFRQRGHEVAHPLSIAHQFDPSPRGGVTAKRGRRPANTGERTPGPVRTGELPDQAPQRPGGRGNQPGAAGRLERELTARRPAAGESCPREIVCVRGRNEHTVSYRMVPPSRRTGFFNQRSALVTIVAHTLPPVISVRNCRPDARALRRAGGRSCRRRCRHRD